MIGHFFILRAMQEKQGKSVTQLNLKSSINSIDTHGLAFVLLISGAFFADSSNLFIAVSFKVSLNVE